MSEVGSGTPLVIVPGLDGHGSWLRPAVRALARHFRVHALSLSGERGSAWRFRASDAFETQIDQLDEAMGAIGRDTPVVLMGVSYGGWIALSYAARHPDRTAALILVSSPPPGFRPNPRQTRHLRAPLRSAPAFVLQAPLRIGPEILRAIPSWGGRVRFTAGHLARVALTGLSPTRMAWRMRVAAPIDFVDACRRIDAPTLIVTGEPGLDRVVPVEETRKYLTLIPGAEIAMLRNTGHIGSLTQPDRLADTVAQFVERATQRGERVPRAAAR